MMKNNLIVNHESRLVVLLSCISKMPKEEALDVIKLKYLGYVILSN